MGLLRGLCWRVMDECSRWRLRRRVSSLGEGVRVMGMPIVTRSPDSIIEIGEGVVLCSRSESTALGVAHPVVLRTFASGARITIGRDTGMSGTTVCAATAVSIGAGCLFGADVQVTDTDFHAIAPEGRRYAREGIQSRAVCIGNNVFVGARALILKGASIGDNSVIGAGSVVVGTIPPNVIAAGVPAKILRPL